MEAVIRSSFGLTLSPTRQRLLEEYLRRKAGQSGLTMAAYTQSLHPDASAARMADVLEEITNQETSFFRGSSQLQVLRSEGLGPIIAAARTSAEAVRIWSGACATGEEAITLAIMASEESEALADESGRAPRIEVVASDLSRRAVERARAGRFSPIGVDRLGAERIDRHFEPDTGALVVRWDTLPPVEFHVHNLLRNNPFGSFDVVIVRNVLFYLDEQAQRQAIRHSLQAVRAGGMVVFGANDGVDLPTGFVSVGAHCWRRKPGAGQ